MYFCTSGFKPFHSEAVPVFSRSAGGVGVVAILAVDLAGNWGVVDVCVGLDSGCLGLGEVSSSSASEVSPSLSSLIDAGISPCSRRPRSAVGLVGVVFLPFFDPEDFEGNSHCLLPLRHP